MNTNRLLVSPIRYSTHFRVNISTHFRVNLSAGGRGWFHKELPYNLPKNWYPSSTTLMTRGHCRYLEIQMSPSWRLP